MEEQNSWKRFETTGSVGDYLNYRQTAEGYGQRKETGDSYEQWGNYSSGYDTPECTTGGI